MVNLLIIAASQIYNLYYINGKPDQILIISLGVVVVKINLADVNVNRNSDAKWQFCSTVTDGGIICYYGDDGGCLVGWLGTTATQQQCK